MEKPKKIRLRKGEEAIELDGRRFLIGIRSTKDGMPIDVEPGAEFMIPVRVQLAGVITSLLLAKDTAENFELVDWRIGKNSQFVNADPIPLAMFAHELPTYPYASAIELHEDEVLELLDLDVIQIMQDVTLQVRNTSDRARPFVGAGYLHVLHR